MQSLPDLTAKCRESRGDPAHRDLVKLVEAYIEKWKEDSIGKTEDEVAKYHGAIIHVRRMLKSLSNDHIPRQREKPDEDGSPYY
jgi:hypothetical protein